MLCFRKLPVAKKMMDKRGGGVSRLSVEKILSHNAHNFHKGTLLCCVSEKIPQQKRSGITKWGYQDLPSKSFVSQSAESIVGETFCAVFQKFCAGGKDYG